MTCTKKKMEKIFPWHLSVYEAMVILVGFILFALLNRYTAYLKKHPVTVFKEACLWGLSTSIITMWIDWNRRGTRIFHDQGLWKNMMGFFLVGFVISILVELGGINMVIFHQVEDQTKKEEEESDKDVGKKVWNRCFQFTLIYLLVLWIGVALYYWYHCQRNNILRFYPNFPWLNTGWKRYCYFLLVELPIGALIFAAPLFYVMSHRLKKSIGEVIRDPKVLEEFLFLTIKFSLVMFLKIFYETNPSHSSIK